MCIFSALFRTHPDCPLFVLANRDESHSRPTLPPQRNAGASGVAWVGGIDRMAGGTWLGVNAGGVMVAVTNRPKSQVPSGIRSRGLLCRDLLAQPSVAAVRAEFDRQRKVYQFAGFNLLVFSMSEAFVFEAGDTTQFHDLSPGLHTIANSGLNDSGDARVVRVHREFEAMRWKSSRIDDWVEAASRIAGLHAEGDAPPVCLHRDGSGTVSSTILALTNDAQQSRYHYAAGPPCTTPFADNSALLRSLLAEDLR